jgi:hypothetical protein
VKALALHLQLFPSDDEGIRRLMKPEYHANPIDPAGSFVVTERGDEVCEFVLRSSGMTTTILSFYDPRLGLKGEFPDVLISGKVPAMYPLPELRNQRTSFDREP